MKVTSAEGIRFEDGPDRGRIIVSGRDTAGAYSLMEYVIAARLADEPVRYGAHKHGAIEETFLLQQGSLEFLLGDQVTVLNAGDFVRVPAGTRHGYANTSGADVHLLVSFIPGGFEDLFVRYRTDAGYVADGDGFTADATRIFGSVFESET